MPGDLPPLTKTPFSVMMPSLSARSLLDEGEILLGLKIHRQAFQNFQFPMNCIGFVESPHSTEK